MIAVAQQDQIEVCSHPDGWVVIRQEDGVGEPEIVYVASENVDRLIRALRAAKREAMDQAGERAA